MDPETTDAVTDWESVATGSGLAGLGSLVADEFCGAVTDGLTWAFLLNGRIVGVFDGSVDAFADADLSAYRAPDPALPLLFAMRETGGEVRGQYYTQKTPLSEVHRTLSEGNFTGYVELAENVLSGDYYVVYHGGRSMNVAFVGASERLVTGDEAFDLAADEVGIYTVTAVDIDVVELPDGVAATTPASTDSRGNDAENDRSDGTAQSSSEESATADTADTDDVTFGSASTSTTTDAADASDADGAADTVDEGTSRSASDDLRGDMGIGLNVGSDRATGADGGAADRADTTDQAADPAFDTDPHVGPPDDGADVEGTEADDATATGDAADGAAGVDDAADTAEGPGTVAFETDVSDEAAEGHTDADEADEHHLEDEDGEHHPDADHADDADPDAEETTADTDTDAAGVDTESTNGREHRAAVGGESGDTDPGEPSMDDTERATDDADPATPSDRGDGDGSTAEREWQEHSHASTVAGESEEDGTATDGTDETDETHGTGTADTTDLTVRLERVTSERDELAAEAERLNARLDTVTDERDELRARVAELDSELERLRAAAGAGETGTGGTQLSPDAAREGTNLFVRYRTKGQPTLEKARAGEARQDDVVDNLRLEYHTTFDNESATVGDEPYEAFLHGTVEWSFVTWVVEDLLYEIGRAGYRTELAPLFDAIPEIDRVQFRGEVPVTVEEDGAESHESRTFDLVFWNSMGDPLFVVDVDTGRQATSQGTVGSLIEDARAVGETKSTLAGAFYVSNSFFDPGALDAVEGATKGGLLSRGSKKSFVKLSRKEGYHICLVEARNRDFHLTVPEL